MIRIRSETGVRSRRDVPTHTLAPLDWIKLAVFCASLQASSFIESGKKRVHVCSAEKIQPDFSLLYLYSVGLVEPIAWDEHDRTRKLLRIRSADLSLQAAQSLVTAGLLPRCFLPVLMSKDLLESANLRLAISDELVVEEFAAWIECGGLGDDQDTKQQAQGANDTLTGDEATAKRSPDGAARLPSAGPQNQHMVDYDLTAGTTKTLGLCATL